jgi:hypothetical protein
MDHKEHLSRAGLYGKGSRGVWSSLDEEDSKEENETSILENWGD